MNENNKSKLCLQCMECCRYIGIVSATNTQEDREFYELRGFETIIKGGFLIVLMPNVCQHLKVNGCSIYEERPAHCRNYDGREDPFMKDVCLWNSIEGKE